MTAPSREAQVLLDRLVEISRMIEAHRATLYQLEHERFTLEAQLRATGWRPEPQQELLR
jgi:hypothetical protein